MDAKPHRLFWLAAQNGSCLANDGCLWRRYLHLEALEPAPAATLAISFRSSTLCARHGSTRIPVISPDIQVKQDQHSVVPQFEFLDLPRDRCSAFSASFSYCFTSRSILALPFLSGIL
jgi:hypothetical protein